MHLYTRSSKARLDRGPKLGFAKEMRLVTHISNAAAVANQDLLEMSDFAQFCDPSQTLVSENQKECLMQVKRI